MLVTSRVSDVRLSIHYSWYVMYQVHHCCSCIASSLFQAGPSKRLHHGRDAQVPIVLSTDESHRSSLDHLTLMEAVLGMRVPHCGSIFQWLVGPRTGSTVFSPPLRSHSCSSEWMWALRWLNDTSSLCARSTIICGRWSLQGTSHCQQQVAVFHLGCSCDELVFVC